MCVGWGLRERNEITRVCLEMSVCEVGKSRGVTFSRMKSFPRSFCRHQTASQARTSAEGVQRAAGLLGVKRLDLERGGSAIFIICRGFCVCVSLFSICKFGLILFSLMIVMT